MGLTGAAAWVRAARAAEARRVPPAWRARRRVMGWVGCICLLGDLSGASHLGREMIVSQLRGSPSLFLANVLRLKDLVVMVVGILDNPWVRLVFSRGTPSRHFLC